MLQSPLVLPCGQTLPNRLAKAATTERISDHNHNPTLNHLQLYQQWSETGAGLLITGNVMSDKSHLESAGNVVVRNQMDMETFKAWAKAATSKGNHAWVQIGHSGRQTTWLVNPKPYSASNIKLKKLGLFAKPREMPEAEINAFINRFVVTASLCKAAGFTGIQIHAAHGYLISQFLSPFTNKRTDQWGGSLVNRSRLLMNIVKACREELGDSFPISVKLNSADFQRGGFEESDSLEVIKMLDQEGIDLLEVSGGTYERLAFFDMAKKQAKESTQKREAYFIDFTKKVRDVSAIPLMLTGGFRTRSFCDEVLEKGEIDVIGMARPFITDPEKILGFVKDEIPELPNYLIHAGVKPLEDYAEGGYYAKLLIQLSKKRKLSLNMSHLGASFFLILHELRKSLAMKRR